jgi:hypothetical protein
MVVGSLQKTIRITFSLQGWTRAFGVAIMRSRFEAVDDHTASLQLANNPKQEGKRVVLLLLPNPIGTVTKLTAAPIQRR